MQKNKVASRNRFRMYLVFWSFIIITFLSVICVQLSKYNESEKNVDSIKYEISKASEYQQTLLNDIDSRNNINSVKKIHDDLGMVGSNEIVFRDDNFNSDN